MLRGREPLWVELGLDLEAFKLQASLDPNKKENVQGRNVF